MIMPLAQKHSDGNLSAVEAALEAGAHVSGAPRQTYFYTPIVVALFGNHTSVVDLYLLEHGADPDIEFSCPSSDPLSKR